MNVIIDWLYSAGLAIGFVLTGFAAMVSIGLLTSPDLMLKTMKKSNERYSLRRALKPVEIPRDADRIVYRYHRIAGTILIFASSFFLFVYLTESPQVSLATWLSNRISTDAFTSVISGLGGFLAIGNFIALGIGVVLLVRPSALKPVERIANRWFSTRRATRVLDKEFGQMDTMVWSSPRLTGGLLLAGTLYILVNLFQIILPV